MMNVMRELGVFQSLATQKGIHLVKSSVEDDMHKHVDFWDDQDGYDVKGMRRIRRDGDRQDLWFYVELTNVQGNRGWLFGEADFIVFERERAFYIASRPKLIKVVRKVTQLTPELDSPKLHRVYRRNKDRMTLINLEDLLLTEPVIWNKLDMYQ